MNDNYTLAVNPRSGYHNNNSKKNNNDFGGLNINSSRDVNRSGKGKNQQQDDIEDEEEEEDDLDEDGIKQRYMSVGDRKKSTTTNSKNKQVMSKFSKLLDDIDIPGDPFYL